MCKKILLSLAIASFVFNLCSCGSSNAASNTVEAESKGVDIEEVESAIQEESTADKIEESILDEAEKIENVLEIHIGDIFVLSDGINELEITLNSVDLEQEVHSLVEDTNRFSQYYADVEDETFVVMKLNIKNIGSDSISYQVFGGYNDEKRQYNQIILTFDNKYNYQMAQLDTQSIVMSSYWNLAPLKSQEVYFLQSIPDEIIDKPYVIEFSLTDGDLVCRYSGRGNSKTEKSDTNDMNSIDGNYIADLLEKYPEYVNELSNYVTSIHRQDFFDGKSFADFEDYDDYFEDFYDWANEIINYKGNVPSEYQELWSEFQNLIIYHVNVLDESYNKDNKEALNLISQLMNYISDKSKAISQQIRNYK